MSQKGGVASREMAATKEDPKDLDRLKLGSKVKNSRSGSKGQLLMVVTLAVILKKPEAYAALGPILACYSEINVSLSNFLESPPTQAWSRSHRPVSLVDVRGLVSGSKVQTVVPARNMWRENKKKACSQTKVKMRL